jgi:hypothetical protein
MALVATPGAANANSFSDVAEGDIYFGERLFSASWIAATAGQKESALIMATRLIAAWFIWNGQASSSTQALPFPRIGLLSRTGFLIPSDVIPRELKEATFELALVLLNAGTTDPTAVNEIAALGISKIKASSIELNFRELVEGKLIPEAIKLLIPPSWYELVFGQEETDYATIEVL